MCLKDEVKRVKNSCNIILTSLNDESDNLYTDSSDFLVTLPNFANPHNHKQALVQVTKLVTPPLKLVDSSKAPSSLVFGVEIEGLGILTSQLSGHSSNILAVGTASGNVNSNAGAHQSPTEHGTGLVKLLRSPPLTYLSAVKVGLVALDIAGTTYDAGDPAAEPVVPPTPSTNPSDNWRVGDQFYILPRRIRIPAHHTEGGDFATFETVYNTASLVKSYIDVYKTQLAIGEVTERTVSASGNYGGSDYHTNGHVTAWKLLHKGSLYMDENFKGAPAVSLSAPLKGGFSCHWFRWRTRGAANQKKGAYDTNIASTINKRTAAAVSPSGLRVYAGQQTIPHVPVTQHHGTSSGFTNPRGFIDDAVMCANPFGKRLRVRVLNMARSTSHRTSDSAKYTGHNRDPSKPPVLRFETLGETVKSKDAAVVVDVEHPIEVQLRVMLVDPEDMMP